MTETSFIATTLANLSQSISNMNTYAASVNTTLNARTPLLNPYNRDTPFDLSSLAVLTAYAGA